MEPDSRTEPIATVETTLGIVEELTREGRAGVTDLAAALDLPKSTVHSHLSTLEQNDYLVKNEGGYSLSLRFLGIGEKARNEYDLYRVAAPEVDRLAEETGEIASVMVEEHGLGVFLYRAEGERTVQLDSYSGYRTHLHTTALGKAILAYLPEKRLEEIVERRGLPQRTENTITDREALAAELDEVRERQVAFDDEERLRGVQAVAAPIVADDGTSIGSISLAGPTRRLENNMDDEEFPAMVRQAANIVELNFTHRT